MPPLGGGARLRCALAPSRPAQATVSVDFTVPADLPGGPVTNSATVASDLVDPDPADDTASDTDMVIEVADLVAPRPTARAVVAGSGGYAYRHGHQRRLVGRRRGRPQRRRPGRPARPDGRPGRRLQRPSGNAISCTLPASLPVGATRTVTIPYSVPASATPGPTVNVATARATSRRPAWTPPTRPTSSARPTCAFTKGDGVPRGGRRRGHLHVTS